MAHKTSWFRADMRPTATCDDCPWTYPAPASFLPVEPRDVTTKARQHVRSEGHRVHVDRIARTIHYAVKESVDGK